ncbi:MAG: 50S ribosome-binding GTPase [Ardenticatenaceae bacterium]|nr:50S ribosome-binding GTPase [Ardenticatenaceae bacterium]
MSSSVSTVSLPAVVLVGLESVGKSALFRALTGQATGDELNFRGSTIGVRTAPLPGQVAQVVDTPGIRVADDSDTTRLALAQIEQADTILLVARGTHARQEVETLLAHFGPQLTRHKAVLVLTFADRSHAQLSTAVQAYTALLGVPVALVNARQMAATERTALLQAVETAVPLAPQPVATIPLPDIPIIQPQTTLYERSHWGAPLSLLTLFLLFAVPVYLAYILADSLQPIVDAALIEPLVNGFAPLATVVPLLYEMLVGDYGVITLGWYSFLWAFPVVLFMGVSVAVTEEMGLKDRIMASLDPWLRRIGLNGRDLIPVLSGYGCNVVAVFQSRACSRCTREACTSLIGYGSACSYQIGATLSLFAVAGHPTLFVPYLLLLFVVGAIHTRIWYKPLPLETAVSLADRSFLQKPSGRAVLWRVRAVLKQFLWQAMPIFLLMCAVGAVLADSGLLDWLAAGLSPLLGLFGLPGAVAPGVIFAIVRKDGLLILNQGEGALLASLSVGQMFVLVYLASTFTACLVTLWTARKELGGRVALKIGGRQALTSLVSTFLLALVVV